ncbi:hypothetical protein FB567DRAFT_548582 [Paraphoma chrysanthemicola]|uniref:Uncharacterized protein n=1 Tax=Paraphoma chrysanthemicola TaxID=798071 RepID=A0A8K0R855_9PLEO|nr:hypothetical protein FB567DRAFT_548582 [Paraphoma chrysanthemicola]
MSSHQVSQPKFRHFSRPSFGIAVHSRQQSHQTAEHTRQHPQDIEHEYHILEPSSSTSSSSSSSRASSSSSFSSTSQQCPPPPDNDAPEGEGLPLTFANLQRQTACEAVSHNPSTLIYSGPSSPLPEQIARANRWGTMAHDFMHFDLTRFVDHQDFLDARSIQQSRRARQDSLGYIDGEMLEQNYMDYTRNGHVEEYVSIAGQVQAGARRVVHWRRN